MLRSRYVRLIAAPRDEFPHVNVSILRGKKNSVRVIEFLFEKLHKEELVGKFKANSPLLRPNTSQHSTISKFNRQSGQYSTELTETCCRRESTCFCN